MSSMQERIQFTWESLIANQRRPWAKERVQLLPQDDQFGLHKPPYQGGSHGRHKNARSRQGRPSSPSTCRWSTQDSRKSALNVEKKYLNKLARHIKEVHDNVRKHCPFCPKMFHATNLKKHIRDVHHGVKVNCPLCPKHFPSSSLKTHIRGVHYRERKKCPHCPKNIHPNGLSQHIRTRKLNL